MFPWWLYALGILMAARIQPCRAFPVAPISIPEELGCSPTLSTIFRPSSSSSSPGAEEATLFFDPLGLATDDNFARYREAELKHGRVAMLAVVYSVADSAKEWATHPTGTELGKEGVGTGILGDFFRGDPHLTPSLFQMAREWQMSDYYKFLAVCAFLETVILIQINPQDMPGDYGLGYFGVRDKGRHERSLISELENGRLAMMVMLYYLVEDLLQEAQVWNLFSAPVVDGTASA